VVECFREKGEGGFRDERRIALIIEIVRVAVGELVQRDVKRVKDLAHDGAPLLVALA
jgi:hypothetical protein